MCNHEYGVLVASGVDEQGEWQSFECIDCGQIWLERSNGSMEIGGYIIGNEPTDEEFRTYFRVQHFLRNEWVANWLNSRRELYGDEPLSQREFELLVHRFEVLDFSAEEDFALCAEYHELIEEREA